MNLPIYYNKHGERNILWLAEEIYHKWNIAPMNLAILDLDGDRPGHYMNHYFLRFRVWLEDRQFSHG